VSLDSAQHFVDLGERMQDRRTRLVQEIWEIVDWRLREALEREFEAAAPSPLVLDEAQRIVLVGHRTAGKSRLLPLLADWTGRTGIDLDAELEARSRRTIAGWLEEDASGFRQAEREVFESLPAGTVIAAGGGFLSLHASLLVGQVPVLVPISKPTYRERLLSDTRRPRLRPDLSLDEEIDRVYDDRERRHAEVATMSLPVFLKAAVRVFGS
jgi:shikimate kinase